MLVVFEFTKKISLDMSAGYLSLRETTVIQILPMRDLRQLLLPITLGMLRCDKSSLFQTCLVGKE